MTAVLKPALDGDLRASVILLPLLFGDDVLVKESVEVVASGDAEECSPAAVVVVVVEVLVSLIMIRVHV